MASMTFLVNDFATESINPQVRVTITENSDGTLTFSVTQEGNIIGDLRGLFFDVKDESLMGALSLQPIFPSPAPTEFVQPGNDAVTDLGNGANMNGLLGSGGGYDVGIEIGTPGIGADDIRTYSFTLDSSLRDLTLQDFTQVDFGVRLTSVGTVDGSRDGSSKILETTFQVVTPVPDDSGCVEENTQFTGNVLANDKVGIAPSDLLTVISWSGDGHTGLLPGATISLSNAEGATLTINADGSYTVDASAADALSEGEHLTYTFTYDILQTNEEVNTATASSTLTVEICGVNDGPVAHDDNLRNDADCVKEDGILNSGTFSVLANDTDVDRLDTKSVVAVNGVRDGDPGDLDPTAGSIKVNIAGVGIVTMHADGTFIYDPNGNFESLSQDDPHAEVSFAYTMSDNHGAESSANVLLCIQGENDAPVAHNDDLTSNCIKENAILSSGTFSVLTNDTDIDLHDTKSVVAVNGVRDGGIGDLDPTAGSIKVNITGVGIVTMHADGTFTYDPNHLFDGLNDGEHRELSFTYTMSDNHGAESSANVLLCVQGVGTPLPPIDFPDLSKSALSNIVFYLDNLHDNTNTIFKLKFDAGVDGIKNIDNLNLVNWISNHEDGYSILAYTIHAGTELPNTWDSTIQAGLRNPILFQSGEGVFFLNDGNTVADGSAILSLYNHYKSNTSSSLFNMGITKEVLAANPSETHTITEDASHHYVII